MNFCKCCESIFVVLYLYIKNNLPNWFCACI